MTDKKMTKDEAIEAAEAWERHHIKVTTIRDMDGKIVVMVGSTVEAEFPYAEPVPVPAMDTPIMAKNGKIFFSLGEVDDMGNVAAYEIPEFKRHVANLREPEPVEIVRNGEHKRALELLKKGTNDMAMCDLTAWNHTVQLFLADAEKAGEA